MLQYLYDEHLLGQSEFFSASAVLDLHRYPLDAVAVKLAATSTNIAFASRNGLQERTAWKTVLRQSMKKNSVGCSCFATALTRNTRGLG